MLDVECLHGTISWSNSVTYHILFHKWLEVQSSKCQKFVLNVGNLLVILKLDWL